MPRDTALSVLRRVFTQSAFASTVLRKEIDENELSGPDAGLATELVYGVLRRRAELDRALRKASGKRLKDLDPKLHDVLRLGAYQILFLQRIPDHAAVSAAVDQARKRRAGKGAKQTNAILRNLTRLDPSELFQNYPSPQSEPTAYLAAVGNVNHFIAQVLLDSLGFSEAETYLKASLHPASLTLRVNGLKQKRDSLVEELRALPGKHPLSVHLPEGSGILPARLPAVIEGRATPQDEASMAVVDLLAPEPGETILDLCSAPGGKTTYIAEKMQNKGIVQAYDRLPQRLKRVAESAERLDLNCIQTIEAPPDIEEQFDRVLVDAPCSGLGTLRRHPEIRWRFSEDDLRSLVRTQKQVLRQGADLVKPGGVLVYSLCTVTRQEAEEQLRRLEGEFELEHSLRLGPHQEGSPDGFFAARLRKR